MELIDIRPGASGWDEVWELYEGSFPQKERRSARLHSLALADPCFHTRIAVDAGGGLLGLLFYWESEGLVYIEHIAVNPAMRGQNIGSRLLSAFLAAHRGHRFILEIDPPVDEISLRRLRFYERLGLVANDHHFIHPGFGPPESAIPHRLVLVSYPEPMTAQEFQTFERYLHKRVLAEKG